MNLILNSCRCLFFQTATENLRCCVAQQLHLTARKWKVLESTLQHSKFTNHNGAKMVDVWNVNKLTESRTKTEIGK